MNIILTGQKRCGKSTAAEKILAGLNRSVSGFKTTFESRWDLDEKKLFVESIDGKICRMAAEWHFDGRRTYMSAFEIAAELIAPESELVFIDELGFLEKGCAKLEAAVKATLDREQDALLVIRLMSEGWMQELKSRRDVTVICVTEDNRDTIPEHVLALLGKMTA